MRLLTLGEVIALHRRILLESGGRPGVRALGGTASAVAQTKVSVGGNDACPAAIEKAAALVSVTPDAPCAFIRMIVLDRRRQDRTTNLVQRTMPDSLHDTRRRMKRPAVTITVMPDYGGGPYAWEKPESDSTSYVGICVATAMHGFETEGGTKISSDLETAFNDWTGDFERGADKPEFDWRVFHATGMRLSRRLQSELGDRFRVVYLKPFEDPDREINEYTEVGRCS